VPPFPVTQTNSAKEAQNTMSIFSTIIKDVTSFASSFEKELAKLWGKAPSAAAVASTILEFVAPIIETAFTIEAGSAAGTEVTNLLNTIEQKMVAAKGLITAIGITPTFANVITGIEADLADLNALGGFKGAGTQANISLVLKEIQALMGALPVATTTAPVA
jgi:hypothetical protein